MGFGVGDIDFTAYIDAFDKGGDGEIYELVVACQLNHKRAEKCAELFREWINWPAPPYSFELRIEKILHR